MKDWLNEKISVKYAALAAVSFLMFMALGVVLSTAVYSETFPQYFQSPEFCANGEQRIAAFVAVTADFAGQQNYFFSIDLPAPVEKLDNTSVLHSDNAKGNGLFYVNDVLISQYSDIDYGYAPDGSYNQVPTMTMTSNGHQSVFKEQMLPGNNTLSFILFSPQPQVQAGDLVWQYAASLCSTQVAQGLPEIPPDPDPEVPTGNPGTPPTAEVPEFSAKQAVVTFVACTLTFGLFVKKSRCS